MRDFEGINLKKLAVVVMNMQDVFIGQVESKKALLKKQEELIEFCKKSQIPLFLVENDGFGKTNQSLLDATLGIPRRRLYRVLKDVSFPLDISSLDLVFKKIGTKEIFLTGIDACDSIYNFAKGAKESGYNVLVDQEYYAGYCAKCSPDGSLGVHFQNNELK